MTQNSGRNSSESVFKMPSESVLELKEQPPLYHIAVSGTYTLLA